MIALATILEGMQSRADKSWKLTFGTNELTPDQIGQIGQMNGKVCFLAINAEAFTDDEKRLIQDTKVELAETGKSHGQRLRGILYVNWQNEPEGYENFHDYYIVKMEKIINHFKSKLP